MKCKFCHGFSKKRNSFRLMGILNSSTYECEKCLSIFRYPNPPDLELFNYYSNRGDIRYETHIEEKMAKIQSVCLYNFLKSIKVPIKDIAYYEYGCGRGWLVNEMKKLGLKSTGFDPDKKSIDWGRNNLKANISEGFLNFETNSLKINDKNILNVVSLMHVFEHLSNPVEIIEKIKINFKEHYLYLEVPDGEFESEILKLDTIPVSSYGQHLSSFTEKGIKNLLKNSGYEIVYFEKSGTKNYYRSYKKALIFWNLIDKKYKNWSEKEFSIRDVFFSGFIFSFKALSIWLFTRFEYTFLKKYNRTDFPVIRIISKHNNK